MLYEDRVARFRWTVPGEFNFASDVIDAWAEDRGRVALYWEDARGRELRLTFWDVAGQSRRFANALRGLGIRRGDPVMILLPRIPQWQVAFLGAMRLGALVIPCASTLGAKVVAVRASHSGARAVVAAASALAEVDEAREACPSLEVFVAVGTQVPSGWRRFDDLVAAASREIDPVRTRHDEPAVCFYTSGTTRDPKAVLHGHGYTWAHRYTGEYWLDLRPTDLHWTPSDTGSAKAAYGVLFSPWSLGAPAFLYDGRLDPERELSLLAKYSISTFCAPPAEYRLLAGEDLGRYDLSRLRHCAAAGGPLSPEVVRAWKEASGLTIHDGYGQTEAGLLVANVKGLPVRPGSMGKPFPGHEVGVIDDEGREVEAGEVGEIALRGRTPALFLEYWKNPGETAACRRGDWYLTGDRATRDEQGYFWFAGRGDELVDESPKMASGEIRRAELRRRGKRRKARLD